MGKQHKSKEKKPSPIDRAIEETALRRSVAQHPGEYRVFSERDESGLKIMYYENTGSRIPRKEKNGTANGAEAIVTQEPVVEDQGSDGVIDVVVGEEVSGTAAQELQETLAAEAQLVSVKEEPTHPQTDIYALEAGLPLLLGRPRELMDTIRNDAAHNRETEPDIRAQIIAEKVITADHVFVAAMQGLRERPLDAWKSAGNKERG